MVRPLQIAARVTGLLSTDLGQEEAEQKGSRLRALFPAEVLRE